MHRFESIDLGIYRGFDCFVVGFVDPKPSEAEAYDPVEDAKHYGITLVRTEGSSPFDTNVEIVRMDTSHGQPHMDLVYLPPDVGESRKVWLDDDYTYDRMKQYLLSNWKLFVDRSIRVDDST